MKNAKMGESVDAHTIFPAASSSNVVFACATLKLVDEGRLDLDTPLSHYLPAYVDNDPRIDLITARHVLTHRTGFPNWRPNGKPLLIISNPGSASAIRAKGSCTCSARWRRLRESRSMRSWPRGCSLRWE